MIPRLLSTPRGLALLLLICWMVGYLAPPSLLKLIGADRGIRIAVDAEIAAGRNVEMYVNGYKHEPLTIPIEPGVRRTYSFPPILDDVHFLRIDLGKISGAPVEVYAISVIVDGKVAKRYKPEAIYHWIQSQRETIQGDAEIRGESLYYVQKGYGPNLIITDVFAGGIPSALQFLMPKDRDGIVALFTAAFLLLISLSGIPLVARGQILLILIGIPVLAVTVVPVVYQTFNWPDPVDQAVGFAAFRGLSLIANRMIVGDLLAAALALTIIATILTRWMGGGSRILGLVEAESNRTAADPHRWPQRVVVAVGILMIASICFADLHSRITSISTLPFINDWDANNVNLWKYLVYRGLRPLHDFWFPYGGTWIFGLAPPWGQIAEAGMHASVYIVCFLALVRICGLVPAILLLYIILVSERIQLMWAPWRYLLAVNIALAYVAIGTDRLRFTAWHLLFGVALALALFFEPLQVGYATPAVLAKLVLDFLRRRTSIGDIAHRLALEFALPASYFIVYFTFISSPDELREIALFVLSLGAHSYASAVPTDLAKEVTWPFGVGLLLMAGPAALIGAATYRALSGYSKRATTDEIVIMLGIVGFMFFQKHLVRPVDWQFVTPTLLAMLIWLMSDPMLRNVRVAVAGGLSSGILVWSLSLTGAPQAILKEAVAAPEGAAKSIWATIASRNALANAAANAYSAEHFSSFPSLNTVVERLRVLNGDRQLPTVWVVGDTPMLYVLLGQQPPYNTNDFNTSPIFEQIRVLAWLKQRQPTFAVWNSNDLVFDGFPRVVRVPLLYSEAAATFVPVDSVGEYAILKRRDDNEPPNIGWWRERLGETIDLGGLLLRSSYDRLADCNASAAACTPYLTISVPARLRTKQRLTVNVSVGDLPFTIAFTSSPKLSEYHVRLDRLWFWEAARVAGLAFRIQIPEDSELRVRRTMKAAASDILY